MSRSKFQMLMLIEGDGTHGEDLYQVESQHVSLDWAIEASSYISVPCMVLEVKDGISTEAYTVKQWQADRRKRKVWEMPMTLGGVRAVNEHMGGE